MNQPSLTGTVHLIEPTKTFGQKGFRKRLVVLEHKNGKFTNYVPLDFVQDGCDSVDDLSVGDSIRVTYRLSGRKWQRDEHSEVKFFLSAEALGFERVGQGAAVGAAHDDGAPPFDPGNEEPPPF